MSHLIVTREFKKGVDVMAKEKYIDFEISEEEIRKNFLDWVIIGDNTPIDIAYKANITKVEKVLYPVRNIRCNYTASWSAFSIWEKEEQYTEDVLYIKYRYTYNSNGEPQYTTMKAERYYKNPNYGPAVDKFYKKETKTRTIIVDQHDTGGEIAESYTAKVVKTKNGSSGFEKWLDSLCTVETASDTVPDGRKMPLLESDKYAEEQVMPDIAKKAEKECKDEVPGTKYNSFSVDNLETKFIVTAIYCPIYIVTYEYEGKEYLVYMSGVIRDSCYSDEKAIDSNLAEKKKELDKELEALKSARLKYGLLGFGLPPVLLIIAAIITALFQSQVLYTVAIIAIIPIAVFFIGFKFIPQHKKVKEQNTVINIHLSNLVSKKKEILTIVNNDSISAEQQEEQIKKLIENMK